MSTDGFTQHCREIARRFLLTAVVVDDELSVAEDPYVHDHLTAPGRGVPTRKAPAEVKLKSPAPHPLRVDPITWSFARQGMVCGVVSPHDEQANHEALAKAVARADIVILDWRLNRTSGANALPLLKRILAEDRSHRLRLLAFYTGEPNHERIRDRIVKCLNGIDGPVQPAVVSNGSGNAIDFRACRIVVYGKPNSGAVEPGAIVHEEALADQLIADFADMAEGLLPSLVLTALGAVRENVHRLLECFGHDLDPAFLVHRACLPQPPESEQHIVEQIASELHGIMDDAVDQSKPAGIEAIEHWLKGRFDQGIVLAPRKEGGQGKSMSHCDALAVLRHGIATEPGPLKKGGQEYDLLSHGFSGGADNSRELDRRLAAAMSLRQVPPATWRQLSMGTVVIQTGTDEAATLLCVTPRCDSVRLTDTTRFLFLRLTDAKPRTPQIVVPVGHNEHRRMTIPLNPSQWCQVDFAPDSERRCVLANRRSGADQPFTFKDASGGEYRWVGELKAESAQSIAQAIGLRMSRIPLNHSEWIRRSQGVAKRAN